MNTISPRHMNMDNLLALDRAGTPVIVLFQQVPLGVYIPCEFCEDGTVNWDDLQERIDKQRELEGKYKNP